MGGPRIGPGPGSGSKDQGGLCAVVAEQVFSGTCVLDGGVGGPWDDAGHLPADAPYPGWFWSLLWALDNPVCGQAEDGMP